MGAIPNKARFSAADHIRRREVIAVVRLTQCRQEQLTIDHPLPTGGAGGDDSNGPWIVSSKQHRA